MRGESNSGGDGLRHTPSDVLEEAGSRAELDKYLSNPHCLEGLCARSESQFYHSKIGANFASTSSMIAPGTLSSFLPPRAPRSRARG